ncbi:SURF1 family protein [Neisseriaceae bacterium TC5R-5]|nr:SURF1 family protein [Neisseriaceae bacterium TC5R-5]
MTNFINAPPNKPNNSGSPSQSRAKPKAWLLLLVLALLPFVLAVWQWQRGQEKAVMLKSLTSALGTHPVSLVYRPASPPPEFSRVELAGAKPAGQILQLRNSYVGELSGRRIFQPWRLKDESLVLVDLGWLVDGITLPQISTADMRLQGHWMPVPHHFTLTGAISGWRGLVDNIDMSALQHAYAGPWHQGVVVLETAPDPLRSWPILRDFLPERHYAYALQWLLLGVVLSFLFILMRRRKHAGA